MIKDAICAVLFDADGVFQRTPERTFQAIEALTPGTDKRGFIQALMEAEELHILRQTPILPAWTRVLDTWGCTADAQHLQALWHDIELDLGVLDLVAEVRRRGRLACIASNQIESRGRHMSEALGLAARFDHEFYAYDLKCIKPDVAFFRAMADALELAPGQCLFIDDREPNTDAAASLGMRTYHFPANAGAGIMRQVLEAHGVLESAA